MRILSSVEGNYNNPCVDAGKVSKNINSSSFRHSRSEWSESLLYVYLINSCEFRWFLKGFRPSSSLRSSDVGMTFFCCLKVLRQLSCSAQRYVDSRSFAHNLFAAFFLAFFGWRRWCGGFLVNFHRIAFGFENIIRFSNGCVLLHLE